VPCWALINKVKKQTPPLSIREPILFHDCEFYFLELIQRLEQPAKLYVFATRTELING